MAYEDLMVTKIGYQQLDNTLACSRLQDNGESKSKNKREKPREDWEERVSRCFARLRPRGSQSGPEKRRNESFQVRAKEPLGTDSHWTISKNSSRSRLLINGHKNCFVLLCPIGEQFLLSSFREFVHDGYCLDHGLSGSCSKEMQAVRKPSSLIKKSPSDFKILSARKLKALFQKYKLELTPRDKSVTFH